jgi:hypothetical protein
MAPHLETIRGTTTLRNDWNNVPDNAPDNAPDNRRVPDSITTKMWGKDGTLITTKMWGTTFRNDNRRLPEDDEDDGEGGLGEDDDTAEQLPWKFAKDLEWGKNNQIPTWTENGTEFMIRVVLHMQRLKKKDRWQRPIFYGPKTEWKEIIGEEYLFRARSFNIEDGEEPSLQGHYNSKDESLYPKLIKSFNGAKEYQKLEITDIGEIAEGVTLSRGEDGQITWEGTNPETGKTEKAPFRYYRQHPILTIIYLFFMHKKEGTLFKSLKINRGVLHMKALGYSTSELREYYQDLKSKGLY